MKKLLRLVTLALLTMSFAPKSSAQALAPSKICFSRPEIERYKNECESTKARLTAAEETLQDALSDPAGLAFYQETPFVFGLGAVAGLLAVLLMAKQ